MSIKFGYDSYGNSIDGTDYCSGVETFAQNLIEDNELDAAITFPSIDGWAIPRAEDYILTDSNAKMIVSEKIYRPLKIYVSPDYFRVTVHVDNGVTYVMLGAVKDINGNPINGANIVDYVVEQAVFNTLPAAKSGGLNKGNVFYYTQGDNKINFGEDIHKIFGFDIPNYVSLFKKWAEEATAKKIFSEYYIDFAGEPLKLSEHEYKIEYFDQSVDYSALKVKDIKFRVSYIPMSSDIKLRARKSVRQQEEYIQPINQRAEINSASALGKFMYNTAQKMGTEQITLVKFYTKIGDIPPLGCRVKHNGQHYILTANSLEMTNCVQVKVTHTLSKNWSNKSQYVSVDQKYRNYKIPADILWRNMHWEDYIEITTDGVVENAEAGDLLMSVIDDSTTKRAIIPRIFICDKTDDVTITSFFLYRANRESYDWGVTVPCTTIGMANSMVFSASMKDNLSAGLRISEENNQYCEEVFYCEKNGKLDYARAVLSGGINITDAGAYPQATLTINTPTDKVFDEIFYISKDPGEALKFTYQCHWISDEGDIVIGSKLAENHPLVKKWTENRKFRFLALRKPLRQGEDKVRPEEHMDILILTDEQRKGYFGMQDLISDTQKAFKLMLVGAGLSLLNNAGVKAWAITDENYNLYIGCNDKSKTTLYFSHIHERN